MTKEYQPHLYMICYPNSALVLSHLSPEDFVFRYSYGSASYYSGKLIFAEIDINYRNPYFQIEKALSEFKPHSDGSPKATKYLSSYRVLEHVEIDAIQTMYLANADGTCYPLQAAEYTPSTRDYDLKIYAEITPLTMLTLSRLNMREFGAHLTGGQDYLSVPRLCFMQLDLDIETFLRDFEMDPFMQPPLEGVHPSKLRNAIMDMRHRSKKMMKGLTLDTAFTKESFKRIKHGIMIVDDKQEKFFPMPDLREIEKNNLRFYKDM